MVPSPELILAGLALVFLVYSFVSAALTDHFFSGNDARDIPYSFPPVSLIVPVKGVDDELYENLLSLCQQDYACSQVIFSLRDVEDPAIAVINRVIQDCSGRDICVVVSADRIGANEKVNNLENGYRRAKYDHLVCIDSDIRVGHDYLKNIIPPLCAESVGLVTCIPVYRDSQNIAAAMETVGVNSNILSLWIPMTYLFGCAKYGSGATLAFRRSVIELVGGFESIANVVADDAALGKRIAAKGYRVHLSTYLVHTIHHRDTWKDYFFHALRWNRTIRAVAPGPYISFGLFFGTFYAMLFWFINFRSGWALLFFLSVAFARMVMTSYYNEQYIKDPSTTRYLWLVPLRDLLAPLEWILGFTGNTIHWRGQRYRIVKGERIEKIV